MLLPIGVLVMVVMLAAAATNFMKLRHFSCVQSNFCTAKTLKGLSIDACAAVLLSRFSLEALPD